MDEKKAERFVSFLKNKYGEEGAKKKIQKIQKTGKVDDEDLKEFQASEQKQQQTQAKKALHGAKLNYFKSLKHQCAEDEEVVYYKKGGSVGCGCKKKEDGGKIKNDSTKKEPGIIDKFKNFIKGNSDSNKQQKKEPYKTTTPDKNGEYKDNRGNIILTRKGISERERILNANHNEEGKADPNKKIQQKKKCGGKVKKNEDGSKIKKNCSGAVAKFKMHRQGGSLNGIPFMQAGTPKGGFPTAPKAKDRYSRGTIKEENKDGRQTITITSRTPGYNANYLRNAAKIKRIVEGNDTAYIETPENGLLTKVQPRTAFKGYMGGTPYYSEYIEKNLGPFEHSLSRLQWTNNRIFPSEFKKLQERFNIAYNNAN